MTLQWWCAAGNRGWSWTPVAYPGIWLMMLLIAFVYWRFTRDSDVSVRDKRIGWFAVVLLWLSFDWPLGPLATGFLASAHAVQFLLVVLTVPPLLLIGARAGIVRDWPTHAAARRALAIALHPMVAGIAFNVVIIGTHVPRVNDTLMQSQLGAFAVDISWLIAGLWLWWPLLVRLPARTHFPVPLQMLYLFLATLAHTGIAIVMLYMDHPMYGVYELAPRATSMSAMTDIKIAGGIMELGGAAIIFGVLTAMFFRWSGGTGAERASHATERA